MPHAFNPRSTSGAPTPNLVATALASVLREAAGIASAPYDRPPPL